MASDGADEAALEKGAKIIAESPGADAERLAFELGSLCTAACRGKKSDDITLAVIKISYKKDKLYV
jgi:hypothetical protein